MPEAIETFQVKYKIIEGYNQELDNKINDTISSLYTFIMNVFSLIAPLIGGALYDTIGYDHTMNAHIFFEIILAVLFILFNCGTGVFKKDREKKEAQGKMRDIATSIFSVS